MFGCNPANLAMLDWQAELATIITIYPYAQTRISPYSQNVTVSSQIVTIPHESFAATLGRRGSLLEDTPLLTPCIKGDALCIKIGQEEYTIGLTDCQNVLRGRLT